MGVTETVSLSLVLKLSGRGGGGRCGELSSAEPGSGPGTQSLDQRLPHPEEPGLSLWQR